MRKGKIMEGRYFPACPFCDDGYTHIAGTACLQCLLRVKNHAEAIPLPSWIHVFSWVLSVVVIVALLGFIAVYLAPLVPLGE